MKRVTFLCMLAALPALSAEPVTEPAVAPVAAQAVAAPPASAMPAAKPVRSTAAPTIAPTSKAVGGKSMDRLELGATQITGNQELPKVMYVVPWKRSDLGDLTGRPANSLLDEVLAPVDRDVFRRQNRYYDALRPDTGKSGSGTAQP
jgi:hypothetical protein